MEKKQNIIIYNILIIKVYIRDIKTKKQKITNKKRL